MKSWIIIECEYQDSTGQYTGICYVNRINNHLYDGWEAKDIVEQLNKKKTRADYEYAAVDLNEHLGIKPC